MSKQYEVGMNDVQTILHQQYHEPVKASRQIEKLISSYPSLKCLLTEYNSGYAGSKMLCIDGLLPIIYKSHTYMIPIIMWLPQDFVSKGPICHVKVTEGFELNKSHKNMDHSGKVYTPYSKTWHTNGRGSLKDLCNEMSSVFSTHPPLFAQQKQKHSGSQSQPPNYQSYTSSSSSSGQSLSASMPAQTPSYQSYSGSQLQGPYGSQRPSQSQPGPYGSYGNTSGLSSSTHSSDPYSQQQHHHSSQHHATRSHRQHQTSQSHNAYSQYSRTQETSSSTVASYDTTSLTDVRSDAVNAAKSEVKSKIRSDLRANHQQLASLKQEKQSLKSGRQQVSNLIQGLQQEKMMVDDEVNKLKNVNEETVKDMRQYDESHGNLEVDEVIVATSPVHRQLLETIAADQSLEDTMYHLGLAFQHEVLTLHDYLKQTKMLARKQFTQRALIVKIRNKLKA